MSRSSRRREAWLYLVGALLLLYAVLGNNVALPGYIRFLERAGRSEAGNSFDAAVLFGAAKTVLWMFSFQLGVLALVVARSIRERLHTGPIIGFALVWLAAWSWPSLPAPGRWFYLTFGGAVLMIIFRVLTQPSSGATGRLSRTLFLSSSAFFAAATWEVCGFGSTGRMLHPDQAARPMAHNILVTQSSKLMFEFLFAWGLLLASTVVSRKEPPSTRLRPSGCVARPAP
jgi:hypothetical protein